MTRLRLLVFVVAMLATAWVALAQTSAPWPALQTAAWPQQNDRSRDAAVVIAIGDYDELADIPGARQNGDAWVEYLRNVRGVPHVKFLDDRRAKKAAIEAAVREALGQVKDGGFFWLVFIGHGVPGQVVNGHVTDALLVGQEASDDSRELLQASSVSRQWLVGVVGSARQVSGSLLLLDTCFSGRDSRGTAIAGAQATVVPDPLDNLDSKVTLLTAGRHNEYALPLPCSAEPRPAFSYLALGGLRGWADGAGGGSRDGRVTGGELAAWSGRVLERLSPERRQSPGVDGNAMQVFGLGREAEPEAARQQCASRSEIKFGGGVQVVVPTVNVRTGADGLAELNMDAEEALDKAETVQKQSDAPAEAKRDAWCRLAKVGGSNPYVDAANQACTQWTTYVAALDKLRASLEGDFDKVRRYLALSNKSTEQKKAICEAFLGAYVSQLRDERVAQARKWREELAAGKAPSGLDSVPAAASGPATGGGGQIEVAAGTYWQGCVPGDSECEVDETARKVTLSRAFALDRTEVTVAKYQECVAAGRCSAQVTQFWDDKEQSGAERCNLGKKGREQHPMNCVDWHAARDYCAWRGQRLPTEAEWEYAARAGERRIYAWGDSAQPAARSGNFADASAKKTFKDWTTIDGYDDGYDDTAPVGQFSPNAWGFRDMSGNVWEWVADAHGRRSSNAVSDPLVNNGGSRVLRGGAWNVNTRILRLSFRFNLEPSLRLYLVGFRCARTL